MAKFPRFLLLSLASTCVFQPIFVHAFSSVHKQAFTRNGALSSPLVVLSSSSSSDGTSELDEESRMELVRQLQKTFYKTTPQDEEDEPRPQLEQSTGRMLHLPLWRVGWVEVPGRANCLNVHEGHYTNMFEKILAIPDKSQWYFGHLHLPGGTKAARSGESRFALQNWRDECRDVTRFDEPERSAVVGTLMRITDYRRLQDGRLILLVHALERFVVDEVLQSFPHGVAHVQILPDVDYYHHGDNDGSTTTTTKSMDENFAKPQRASAVVESFRYHNYESDPIPLPLPQDTEYMSPSDVFGVEIARCLPFAFMAKSDSMLPDEIITKKGSNDKSSTNDANTNATSFAAGQPMLEDLLKRDLILRNPPPLTGIKSQSDQSADALETFLWLALEDFCRSTGFVLPEEVACLRPLEMDYLDLPQPKTTMSKKYPKARRQWRLSYHVPALIENNSISTMESGMTLRHVILNTPTTQARLAAILERFQAINEQLMGQFE